MRKALLFACIMFIFFLIGFWLIPKFFDFIIRLYKHNSLFDFSLLILLVFAMWLIGGEE